MQSHWQGYNRRGQLWWRHEDYWDASRLVRPVPLLWRESMIVMKAGGLHSWDGLDERAKGQ